SLAGSATKELEAADISVEMTSGSNLGPSESERAKPSQKEQNISANELLTSHIDAGGKYEVPEGKCLAREDKSLASMRTVLLPTRPANARAAANIEASRGSSDPDTAYGADTGYEEENGDGGIVMVDNEEADGMTHIEPIPIED